MNSYTLSDLRKLAVKHILRKAPADYLLRHALCRPWVASTQLDEMAWTDYKSLFFNFPKIRAKLDMWNAGPLHNGSMDPGDYSIAHLAAVCHEALHVLWLHKHRGKNKHLRIWMVACEWAINYELAKIFKKDWIDHLGVLYPPNDILSKLISKGLPTTTDGFYELLLNDATIIPIVPKCDCQFGNRPKQEQEQEEQELDPGRAAQTLLRLPESAEKADLLRYLTSQQVQSQKIPWDMLLLGGVEDAVNQEQSWAVLSRRNDLLPGWRHEKLLSFVWVLDVSPSIDDEMKQSFVNTVQAGINLYHDAQHRIIFFASGIEADFIVSSGTNLSLLEIPEGNGTDLNEVWAILERDMPEYALVLTDLELSDVPKPSFTQIIWGIVGNIRCFDPDYGTKIVLK